MFSYCGDEQSRGALPAIVLVFWIVSVIKPERNAVIRTESAGDAFLTHSSRFCWLISKCFMEFLIGFPIINEQPPKYSGWGKKNKTLSLQEICNSQHSLILLWFPCIMLAKTWSRYKAILADTKLANSEWLDAGCHRSFFSPWVLQWN